MAVVLVLAMMVIAAVTSMVTNMIGSLSMNMMQGFCDIMLLKP